MLLQGKNAIVYGAGGSLGRAVASAFAAAGAHVFLTGHHVDRLKEIRDRIDSTGGKVSVRIGYANVGGFGPACNAVEGFSRNLAAELGPYGIRVVNIRSAGSPDSRIFKEAIEAGGDEVAEFIKKMTNDTMLKQLPLMEDIANTAVFLSSAMAGKLTGVTVDVTAGTTKL